MRLLFVLALLLFATAAAAAPDEDAATPVNVSAKPLARTAASSFSHGQALTRQNDWAGAETAYRDAAQLGRQFREAWNGLEDALRTLRKLDESLKAYQEALRRRPEYPQALEYLGEAYVQLGPLKDARDVLARLRPLDAREADELARAIARAAKR